MNTLPNKDMCVCGVTSCVGCDCGMDCAYSPGHREGTVALQPLASLVEAIERLFTEQRFALPIYSLEENGTCLNSPTPGIRRLRATLAFAKQSLKDPVCEVVPNVSFLPLVYHIQYQQEHIPVSSMREFYAAAMTVLVRELVQKHDAGEVLPYSDKHNGEPPYDQYAEMRKNVADVVIPSEQDEDALCIILSFDSSLLTRRCGLNGEETEESETSAATLIYRGLAESVEGKLEDYWDECIMLAQSAHPSTWEMCVALLNLS